MINAVMFAIEMTAGQLPQSKALQADTLDFFADALTYGLMNFQLNLLSHLLFKCRRLVLSADYGSYRLSCSASKFSQCDGSAAVQQR